MGVRSIRPSTGSFAVLANSKQLFFSQGVPSANTRKIFAPLDSSTNSTGTDIRKQFLPFFSSLFLPTPLLSKKKFKLPTFLRYCFGRSVTTELSSEEESLEIIIPVEKTSIGSADDAILNSVSKKTQVKTEDSCSIKTVFETFVTCNADHTTKNCKNKIFQSCGESNFNASTVHSNNSSHSVDNINCNKTTKPDLNLIKNGTQLPLRSYKVIIEYCQGKEENKRPTVKLSTLDSINDLKPTFLKQKSIQNYQNIDSTTNKDVYVSNVIKSVKEVKNRSMVTPLSSFDYTKSIVPHKANCDVDFGQNSKLHNQTIYNSFKEDFLRKSEKERRKNERRQESKAAKTLSAILFAFIVTWTPYNVIVCWETFFPNSIPDILFTISYCLCYVNSTINPMCYALCNARFRMTYTRILRCKSWKKFNKSSIYRHAYLKRV